MVSLNHGVMFLEFRFLVLRGAIESITESRTLLNSLVKVSRGPVWSINWLMAVGRDDSRADIAAVLIHRLFEGWWLVTGRGNKAVSSIKQWSVTDGADGK